MLCVLIDMVLNKRLDYGFSGYQVPPTPRAKRSARRRSFKKRSEEEEMCAFDLLAIVAGNLLLEGRGSAPGSSYGSADKDHCVVVNNTVQRKCEEGENSLYVEIKDQGNPSRAFFVSDLLSRVDKQNEHSKESLYIQNNLNLGLASAVTTPDCAQKSDSEILVVDKSKIELQTFSRKVEVGSTGYHEFVEGKLDSQPQSLIEDPPQKSEVVQSISVANQCSSEDPVVCDGKPSALASSDCSAKLPFCRDSFPHISYPINRDHVNVVSRDDDENSSRCTHPSTIKKSFRPARRVGDRRIRKILAAKYRRAGPRLMDESLFSTDRDLKLLYRKRKNYYKYQRSERVYPFKKRKHFNYISPLHSDGGIGSEFVLDSTQKSNYGHASGSCPKLHGATGVPSSIMGQQNLFRPRNSRVKLKIKSFKVPELVIEVPESATVGSLKRTVMDAVTALLGGGLRIGVLLQGKKVRDDGKTLLQSGISHDGQLDSLGFSLEPNPSQSPSALDPGDSSFLPPFDRPQPLSRYSPPVCEIYQGSCATSQEPLGTNVANLVESEHDSAPSPIDLSIDRSTTDAQCLVPLQAMDIEALAVVPAHRKSKHSEFGQRRIRRPFSVGEVEALVHAVEKLGTGRWRDVKLRAFEKAKHRTYVDLKDKWKTLVHTARISPQQRRGEPVPQELLDRVLAAHAYWSQQQAKQQLKQMEPDTSHLH